MEYSVHGHVILESETCSRTHAREHRSEACLEEAEEPAPQFDAYGHDLPRSEEIVLVMEMYPFLVAVRLPSGTVAEIFHESRADIAVEPHARPVEIDEQTMSQIAGTTNGNYFRATSNSKLKDVYREIDKLEKTKLNVKEFSKREEAYELYALIAFLCILLEIVLRNTVLKKIP